MALVKVTIDWWLSPYGNEIPEPMVGIDMEEHGYVKIGSETVMVERPEVDPSKCKLQSLKQQRNALEIRRQQELADYDRKIEELSHGK